MKRTYLIFGVILFMLAGIAFVGNNVGAVDDSNSMSLVVNTEKTSEKQSSDPEKIYKELKNKALSRVGEGWLYMREYVDYDVDAPVEEGETPLVDTKTESWFYINISGMVEKSVSIGRATDSDIPLVGVFSDGSSWDTVVDEFRPTEPYLFEPFDFGLSSHLKKPELKSEKITKNDSKKITKFTIKYTEEEPVQLSVYSKKLLSMMYEFDFDDETGFIVGVKVRAFMDDGAQRDFYTVQIEEIRFNVEPPAEVLQYFEIKKSREMQP